MVSTLIIVTCVTGKIVAINRLSTRSAVVSTPFDGSVIEEIVLDIIGGKTGDTRHIDHGIGERKLGRSSGDPISVNDRTRANGSRCFGCGSNPGTGTTRTQLVFPGTGTAHHHGTVEQSLCIRTVQQHLNVLRASTLTHHSDTVRVTAKGGNVIAHPCESCHLILQAVIASMSFVMTRGKGIQTIVDADQNDTALTIATPLQISELPFPPRMKEPP